MSEIKDCPTCGSKVTVEGDEGTYFYKPVETPEILVLTPDEIREQDEILTMREKFELVRLIAPSETDEGVLVFYGEQAKRLGAYLPDSLICVRRQADDGMTWLNGQWHLFPTKHKIISDGDNWELEHSVDCRGANCDVKDFLDNYLFNRYPNAGEFWCHKNDEGKWHFEKVEERETNE